MTDQTASDLAAQTAPPGVTPEEWWHILQARQAATPAPAERIVPASGVVAYPTVVARPTNVPELPETPSPAPSAPAATVTIGSGKEEIEWVSVDLVGEMVLARVPKMLDSLAMASAASKAFTVAKKGGEENLDAMTEAAGGLYREFVGHVESAVHPDHVARTMERLRDSGDALDFDHINQMVAALQELASRRADLPPTSPGA